MQRLKLNEEADKQKMREGTVDDESPDEDDFLAAVARAPVAQEEAVTEIEHIRYDDEGGSGQCSDSDDSS